jgi:hypothetical protein
MMRVTRIVRIGAAGVRVAGDERWPDDAGGQTACSGGAHQGFRHRLALGVPEMQSVDRR